MCGRFVIGGDFRDKLNELMEAEGIAPDVSSEGVTLPARGGGVTCAPIYADTGQDVFPSDASLVFCQKDGGPAAAKMFWGFSNPYRKGLIINARAETAREKPLFADSIMNRRCLIPASGFYEWDPYKARFRFADQDDGLILLAGFFREEAGQPRYTILTTQANESMSSVHDRMPVMIRRSEIRAWISDNEKLEEFLTRPQVQLACEQDSGQIRMNFGV